MTYPGSAAPGGSGAHEVRAYLVKLVSLILVGVVLMAATVLLSWHFVGTGLEEPPPKNPYGPAVPPRNGAAAY